MSYVLLTPAGYAHVRELDGLAIRSSDAPVHVHPFCPHPASGVL